VIRHRTGGHLKNLKALKVREKPYGLSLRLSIIRVTFPKEEHYGRTSQVRRSAVSVPSNISEGYDRKANADTNIRNQTFESLTL
jgi:four helix bundle protein